MDTLRARLFFTHRCDDSRHRGPYSLSTSDTGDSQEIELKLRIPPELLPRLMQHRLLRQFGGGRPVRKHLVSTYFDTPDFRLMQAEVALRVRKDGRRRIQTVKCAPTMNGGPHARREWEQDVAADLPMLDGVGDKRVRKLFAKGKVRSHLAAQFVTDVQRATWPLKMRGSEVELAVDVGEIKTARGNVSFCEAEFELKGGKIDGIYRLARELHKSIPFTIEPLSKAARGFALVAETAPRAQRAQALKLDKDCTVGEAFQRIGRSCLFHMRANEGALRGGRNSEGVHQFRVAIRRLRSALSAFRHLLPPAERRKMNNEMRWIAQQFGRARDWDVFHSDVLGEVRRHMSRDKSLPEFAAAARSARAEAQKAVAETILSPRYTDALLQVEAWWESGAWQVALGDFRDEKASEFARRALKKLHRRMGKLGDRLGDLSEADLHQLRIRAKKLRYAAEFFRSLFPAKAAKAYLEALEGIQDRLGSLNDGVTVKHLLSEIEKRNRNMDKAALARATGIVSGWGAARVAEDLRRLPAAWNRFMDTKPFWK